MKTITECIWGADFYVNYEDGDTGFYFATNSMDVLGNFTEDMVETACVEWMAGQMEVKPEDINLVSLTWSSYLAVTV